MERRYFQSVRDGLFMDGLIFSKSINLGDTLVELDMAYPFDDGAVSMDSITGGTHKEVWKEINKMAKRLDAKLSNKVHADDNVFSMHQGFKVVGKGKGESVKYLPFTLELDDGQVLTVLAKNVKDYKTLRPNQDLIITHFMLNKKDITAAIYKNGDTNIDVAETVSRLKTIIEGAHTKFIAKNPIEKSSGKAQALMDEISSMSVDLSNVVDEVGEEPMTKDEKNRLISAFNEITDFAEKSGREPEKNKENIGEYKLGARLEALRGNKDHKAILKEYDTLGLLDGTYQSSAVDDQKEQFKAKAFYIGEQAFKNGEPESPMRNKTLHKFLTDNRISVHLSKDIQLDREVTEAFNDGYDSAKEKGTTTPQETPDYTVILPAGAEKYIPFIRKEFQNDEKLKDKNYVFVVNGVVMDAIDRKSVSIEGGEKSIQTHMKKIIHFITIGADKIEGKDVNMPSVDLIRNAEFVKDKTGLDYEINHHQNATFLTEREEFQIGEDGRGHSLMRPIGNKAGWSVKERWLMSDASRKRIIEMIGEELAKDKQKEDTEANKELGFVQKILKKPHTISENGEILTTTDDGKRYHITEDYYGEEGITDLTLIENDVEITRENIAEHYPTMTNFQKNENQDTLDSIFKARAETIANGLGFNDPTTWLLYADYEESEHGTNVIGQTVFGVKDELHSLDRYISEIKESEEYKAYIKNTTPKTEEHDKLKAFIDNHFGETINDKGKEIIRDFLQDKKQENPKIGDPSTFGKGLKDGGFMGENDTFMTGFKNLRDAFYREKPKTLSKLDKIEKELDAIQEKKHFDDSEKIYKALTKYSILKNLSAEETREFLKDDRFKNGASYKGVFVYHLGEKEDQSRKPKRLLPNYNYDKIVNPIKAIGKTISVGDILEFEEKLKDMPQDKVGEIIEKERKSGVFSNASFNKKHLVRYPVLEVREVEKYPIVDADPARAIQYRLTQSYWIGQRSLVSKNYKIIGSNKNDTDQEPKPLSIKAKLKAIKPFMNKSQYKVISAGMDKEDYEFNDVIDRLYKTITTMPKTYEQDGKGDDAVAYLHYFNSGSDWYITEKDMGDEQVQAFGYAVLNGDTEMAEMGYISIEELVSRGVELDFHYSEQTIGEIKGTPGADVSDIDVGETGQEESREAEHTEDENFAINAYLSQVGEQPDSERFEKKLDEVVDLIEEKGLMDEYEDELNKLADQLTELMKSENA